MLDFLFNKKYANPTNLSQYQDLIISKPGLNLAEVDGYISEFKKYDTLFTSFMGLNAIAENNLFIRQQLILGALYYVKKDFDNCKSSKERADNALHNLKVGPFYLEGYSYLLCVVAAYEFYFKFVGQYVYGDVDLNSVYSMRSYYGNMSGPDGSVLMTDTCFTDKVINHDRIGFGNWQFSAYYLNNQSTYVFINHNTNINRLSKNLHVNYEFGHFCVFNHNKWLIVHPFYPGYADKANSDIKETWNNNVILNGINTKEPYWRYLPKQELHHEKKGNVHYFRIGKDITRKIEILNNGIFVTDNGGDYSSFNLSDDCKFNYSGRAVEKVGYHSPERGKVEKHRRLELSGDSRIFWMEF